MALKIAEILAADDRKIVRVKCPEWGGEVCMMPFSGHDRDWYDQIYTLKRFGDEDHPADWQGLRSAAVARALCDENGESQGVSDEQMLALGEKSAAAIDRCYTALKEASGIGVTADEDAEKNSSPDQSDKPG